MRKSILLTVFAFFVFFSYAEDFEEALQEQQSTEQQQITEQTAQEAASGRIVSKIDFIGLTKTRDSYLQLRYKKYIGMRVDEIDLRELETQLQSEGVFESIVIDVIDGTEDGSSPSFDEDGNPTAKIEVSVSEKITFIPLPFAMYSSSGLIAGGMVMDTNAFGVKDTLMLGGFFASTSLTGMGMFSKPAIERVRPGFQFFTSISKNTPNVRNLKNEEVLDFENFAVSCSLGIFNKIDKFNTFGLSLGFNYLKNDTEGDFESIGSATIGSAGLAYSLSKSDWNGFFMSTSSINLSASLSKYFALDDEASLASVVQNYAAAFSTQKPFLSDRFRLLAQVSGACVVAPEKKSAHIVEAKKRSAAGVSILSGDFKTDMIFGGTAGFEAALATFKFGLISLIGKYEVVWTEDFSKNLAFYELEDVEFCHGPSAGLCLYLSKIAFPALSMNISYNVSESYWQYSFSLGMSM